MKRQITITIDNKTVLMDTGHEIGDKKIDQITESLQLPIAQAIHKTMQPILKGLGVGKTEAEAQARAAADRLTRDIQNH